jgi:signal peptidase I
MLLRVFGSAGAVVGAVIGGILATYLIWKLEDNCLLSRFFGLQTEPGVSPIKAYLYEKVRGKPRQAQAGQSQGAPQPSTQSVTREIAETVVFVVVLVLLLKAFVAQAFVIPTGSMAVTLYGYQMHVTCPKCGIVFPVNCSNEVDPSDGGPPTPVEACTCPNCRYHIDFLEEMKRNPKFERPSPSTGDRVLVADLLYDLPWSGPKRLDVVVFKYPGDSNPQTFGPPFPISGPQKNQSAMNYIKRLIGQPGETIGIWYGKLYYISGDKLSPEKQADLRRRTLDNIWKLRMKLAPDKEKELAFRQDQGEEPENWEKDRWRWENMFVGDLAEQLRSGKDFQIIRKPPAQILEMRRIVYDNDHPPMDLSGNLRDRWKPEPEADAWAQAESHGFQSSPTSSTSWLRYHHLLRTSEARKDELITDFMGYNTYEPHRGGGMPKPNWVGDLLVECEVAVEQPNGTFTLELSKGVDRFRASWDLSSGKCTLYRLKEPHAGMEVVRRPPEDSEYVELANRPTKLQGKGKHQVRFANIDDRLLVWVDNNLPFGDGVAY